MKAVADVTLEVRDGEFLVITGRSGSGKTTLLNLAAGLTRPTSGTVTLDGVDVWSLTDNQRAALRGRKIGFAFQFPSLLPSLTVLENVLLPTLFAPNGEDDGTTDRAMELIADVGLSEKVRAYPRQLSAGQQQRVVIARALMNRPEVLLADEPTSDLDEHTETEVMDLFRAIHRSRGITIMMVTHSSDLVHYGTRSIAMASGQVVAERDLAHA
ncbi:MAG: ABC transporter ATP-binding protein [Anaerolineae bacterium]|nr:ABC transporter ATP-binding protein [Anaerolineae bacterium]